MRRNILDSLASVTGVYPYRCFHYTCRHRFYRTLVEREEIPQITPAIVLTPERGQGGFVQHDQVDRVLTLYWEEEGNPRVHSVPAFDAFGQSSSVKIGRNPQICDAIMKNPTVSGLHAEIYYSASEEVFCLHNLRATNPPRLNGKPIEGTIVLEAGMAVKLGRVEIVFDVNLSSPELAPTALV
jgi:FHA domain